MNKIEKIKNLMYRNHVPTEMASPNYVAEFTFSRGITLSSEEIVVISETYKNPDEVLVN